MPDMMLFLGRRDVVCGADETQVEEEISIYTFGFSLSPCPVAILSYKRIICIGKISTIQLRNSHAI
jgi:hypothetical protein